MLQVTRDRHESLDKLLRRFRQRVDNTKLVKRVRAQRAFVSRAEKRRIQLQKARKTEGYRRALL